MGSIKSQVVGLINNLPEDSSWEDIQYHIYVREKVEKGINDIDSGDVISQDEAERKIESWLRSSGQKPQ